MEGVGIARFGILALAWIVVGYFSLFDLGLGRAMTQLIAQKLGKSEDSDIPSIVWAGMVLMTVLGLMGAIVVWFLSPWLVESKLAIPAALREETLTAFYLLAASIPITICSTGLRGILEAHQRFDLVNIVRIPLNALTYVAPVLVLAYSNQLPALVASLVVVRAIMCVAYLLICLRLFPALARPAPFRTNQLRGMLSYGGWMTVSNTAGPLLLYLGRFFLAILISAEAVAYFSTPFDMVINLLIIPVAFTTVYFPMFAQKSADFESTGRLYRQALVYNLMAMFPLALVVFACAKPTLAWWINPDFAEKSFRVAQLLAVGVFINSFGHVSQALVQAFGRPDLTAKLHVLELVAYIPYLWWLVESQGVEGAAVAWVLRVAISTIALSLLAGACLSGTVRQK